MSAQMRLQFPAPVRVKRIEETVERVPRGTYTFEPRRFARCTLRSSDRSGAIFALDGA